VSKIKVVIADDNPRISSLIEASMRDTQDFEVAAVVTDGVLALKAVEQFDPDLLLLDIIMPNLDGLGVLERLDLKKRPADAKPLKVIVLSGVGQDEITFRAMDLGASYYMIKPFDIEMMLHRIRQFLESSSEPNDRQTNSGIDSGVVISNILSHFQLPTHTKGFVYIKEALALISDDLTLLNKVTTSLYPMIAEKHNSSTSRVERAIRNTIELSVNNGDKDLYEKHFGICYVKGRLKITNGDFISVLTRLVRDGNSAL